MVRGFGALEGVSVVQQDARPEGGHTVQISCTYEDGILPLDVVVDAQLRVIGLRPRRPEREALERTARQLIALAEEAKWADAVKAFDPKMAKALPAEKLATLFQELHAQKGRLSEIMAAPDQAGRDEHDRRPRVRVREGQLEPSRRAR